MLGKYFQHITNISSISMSTDIPFASQWPKRTGRLHRGGSGTRRPRRDPRCGKSRTHRRGAVGFAKESRFVKQSFWKSHKRNLAQKVLKTLAVFAGALVMIEHHKGSWKCIEDIRRAT